MIVYKHSKNQIYYYSDNGEECINLLWERLMDLSDDDFRKAQFKVFHYPDTTIEDYLRRFPRVRTYEDDRFKRSL